MYPLLFIFILEIIFHSLNISELAGVVYFEKIQLNFLPATSYT